ncbi:cryptochrome/photolyase family protein [Roseixanthobacter liquoris]|uniref:cryptochrome/photolyase family protein n=1 Tax=Roseixanthobacter liquoris TaxID=3119921 RepID=UPI00372823DC
MPPSPALVWFRDDLRLSDNPALTHAARDGRPVAALYVLDEISPGVRPLGGAARWWLAQSLKALARDLGTHGIPLILRRGPAGDIVPALALALGAGLVAFNSRPGAAEHAVDAQIAAALRAEGGEVRLFNGHLLHELGSVRTAAGTLPRTFSAFHRAALKDRVLRPPLPVPPRLEAARHAQASEDPAPWALEPSRPDWAQGLRATWRAGEAAARERLHDFLSEGLRGYADLRDRPDMAHVSRLSPHLRWGELSPRQVLSAAQHAVEAEGLSPRDGEKFAAELYWREFNHHILNAAPDLATRNLNPAFDAFPWRSAPRELAAWQEGRTGYPIVDAAMRQLWQTGWMHNRMRMVVASFLAKHLLVDWRAGERWFWDTLVDADAASNPGNWQWVAGTGVDAAPYFRIFNPVLQGEKFDPHGAYVRAFVPELSGLPPALIHKPWTGDAAALSRAGVRHGADYPRPIVDHARARARALEAFAQIKAQ